MPGKLKTEKKKMNPFLRLLFAVIIPVMAAISILLIVLHLAGVDVTGWAEEQTGNIPVLSSFITDEEETKTDNGQLQEKIAQKDEEIDLLNEEIRELEKTIERLNQDILKLEHRNEEDTASQVEPEEENDTPSSISSSFKDMDPEQAALIIQNMERDTASFILQEVSNKVRGGILEAMDPEIAADLTQLLIES
jgi:flagellar motility protein MotE (MotC chaperone)